MASLRLTYEPIPHSMHVYLNGLELERGDWFYDPDLNRVISNIGIAEESGDRFECRYAHMQDSHDMIPAVYIGGDFQGGENPTLTYPAGIQSQDLIVVMSATQGGGTVLPPGFSTHYASPWASPYFIFTKRANGTETTLDLESSSSVTNQASASLQVIRCGDILSDTRLEGDTTPAPIPQTNLDNGEVALGLGIYYSGVVSGLTGSAWPSPYIDAIAGSDFGGGKIGFRHAYYIASANGSISPAGSRAYSGSMNVWAAHVLRLEGQ